MYTKILTNLHFCSECCPTFLSWYDWSPVVLLTNPHFPFSQQKFLHTTRTKKILFPQTLTNYPRKSSVHHLQTCFGFIIKQLLQPSTLVGSVHRSQPLVQNVTAHFACRKKTCHSENLLSQPSMCVHLLYISFSCIFFTKYSYVCLPAV